MTNPRSEIADDSDLLIMASIAGGVAALAIARPTLLVRMLLMDPRELDGAGLLALRLFATRNVWVVWRSLHADRSAQEAYLEIQYLDQVVFWQAAAAGTIPKRTAVLAASISGAIILAGTRRRRRLGVSQL